MEDGSLVPIYLLHPQDRYLPGIVHWIHDLRALLNEDPEWAGWKIIDSEHNVENGICVRDRVSQISSQLGPVLAIDPIKGSDYYNLRDRLQMRVAVARAVVTCSEDIWTHLSKLRAYHEQGDPRLPAKYITAMHIIWKLSHEHMWGGNAKGYKWRDDIPKGRGMPEEAEPYVIEVLSDLLLAGLLASKRSKTGIKYCLNADKKSVIYDVMDNPLYPDSRLPRCLSKGMDSLSARLLDNGIQRRRLDRDGRPSASEIKHDGDEDPTKGPAPTS